MWVFSSYGEQASHSGGSSCHRAWALEHIGFSSCGILAKLPCGMWNLSGVGIEPMSPALAGRVLTTCPPGKSHTNT